MHNLEQAVQGNLDDESLRSFFYRIFVKNQDIPKNVVEDWKNPGSFDDLAFRSAEMDKKQARLIEFTTIT
mgnify:CR=1 FL=1